MSEREIVFDTETTGLEAGIDKLVEIGAVELVNRVPTGRVWHRYVNPGRPISPDAIAVHGITNEKVAHEPRFRELAADLAAFLEGATLIAHNASFDVGFLDAEFGEAGLPALDPERVVDTLALARKRFPGANNTLDALCRRFSVDAGRRVKHGALLDAELLAEVYGEMMGGRQSLMALEAGAREAGASGTSGAAAKRPGPRPVRLTDAEAEAHAAFVATLADGGRWEGPRERAQE